MLPSTFSLLPPVATVAVCTDSLSLQIIQLALSCVPHKLPERHISSPGYLVIFCYFIGFSNIYKDKIAFRFCKILSCYLES